jgi:peptidoglycan/LPS O-acetylase OafA/YrhL
MQTEQPSSLAETESTRKAPHPAFYIPQLDCLRFLAFFLVFLHHNIPVGNKVLQHFGPSVQQMVIIIRDSAGFGLSLFFFLSSYLITTLLMLEKSTSETINLRSFYARRVLRIWPLYFAFLALVAIVGHWCPAHHISIARFAAMSVLAGNWFSIFSGLGPFVIGPLWSISVEEQFYVIWPGMFRSLSLRTFVWFTALLGGASLVVTAILAHRGSTSLDLWMNSVSECIFFAGGGLLALLVRAHRRPDLRYAVLMMIGGGALWFILEATCKINDRNIQPTPFDAAGGYLLAAIGCTLLIVGALHFPTRLVPGPMVYLGKISYGLYVFHALAMYLGRRIPRSWVFRVPGLELIVEFLITLALAAVSYKYFEKPFLKLKRRFELVKTRAA